MIFVKSLALLKRQDGNAGGSAIRATSQTDASQSPRESDNPGIIYCILYVLMIRYFPEDLSPAMGPSFRKAL